MEESVIQSTETQAAPVTESAPTEKMLRQSEVNDIVGRVRQEMRQEANAKMDEFRRQQEAPKQTQSNSQHDFSEERFRKMAAEEAQRLRDEWMTDAQQRADEQAAQRIVKNFYDKMEAGKGKYDDFEQTTGDIDLRRFPNTVHMLAEHVDNAHDVLYELGKNRSKMAQLELTARDFPQEALYDLKRLSESIKKNESTGHHREANAPLSQTRSSGTGTDSGGILSMRDLKAKYRV